ncbi:hypothetical protein, partial [Arcticibacter tournemirensis]
KLAPSVVAPGYAPAVSLPPGCHKGAAKVPVAPMNLAELLTIARRKRNGRKPKYPDPNIPKTARQNRNFPKAF